MKNLQFIETAKHSATPRKGIRNLLFIIAFCILLMIVSRMFYAGNVHESMVYFKGSWVKADVGWPANLYSIGSWGLIAFPLFVLYLFFKQDLRKPALGVTNEGIFINQQLLRNSLVPWYNIAHLELRGHASSPVLRVFFKDINLLLKGQFFILKSIAKTSLKLDSSIGISKDEAVGNLIKIFDFAQAQGVTAHDHMAGRSEIKPDTDLGIQNSMES